MLTTLALTAGAVGHHWGGAWLFFLIPLFWIGIVVLIVSLVGRRWSRHGGRVHYGPGHFGPGNFGPHGYWQQAHAAQSAEATLASRFANGDIDEKEYRARLEVLRASGPTPPMA